MASVQEKIAAYKKQLLNELLAQCTPEQQALFHKIYPKIHHTKYNEAVGLVERTIAKNAKKAGQ